MCFLQHQRERWSDRRFLCRAIFFLALRKTLPIVFLRTLQDHFLEIPCIFALSLSQHHTFAYASLADLQKNVLSQDGKSRFSNDMTPEFHDFLEWKFYKIWLPSQILKKFHSEKWWNFGVMSFENRDFGWWESKIISVPRSKMKKPVKGWGGKETFSPNNMSAVFIKSMQFGKVQISCFFKKRI